MDRSTPARHGFWAAVILAALSVVAAAFDPVAGAFSAIVFGACAWAIHRGRAWAAIAAIVFLVAPMVPVLHRNPAGLGLAALAVAAFVILLARAARDLWRRPGGRKPWPWAAAALAIGCFWLTHHPFAVSAGSMENTLLVGDRILVESATWMLGATPSLGEIVVVRYPLDHRQLFIKRVVAGPGDRIRIRNKQLYRNGDAVAEPYAIHRSPGIDNFRDNFPALPTVHVAGEAEDMLRYHVRNGELEVPDGKYFVLGDNRDDSLDSRYWGFISTSDIVGSPVLVYGSSVARWRRLFRVL